MQVLLARPTFDRAIETAPQLLKILRSILSREHACRLLHECEPENLNELRRRNNTARELQSIGYESYETYEVRTRLCPVG